MGRNGVALVAVAALWGCDQGGSPVDVPPDAPLDARAGGAVADAAPDGAAPDAGGLDIPPGCNPLAFQHDCLLPYPSDHFLVDDPTLPGGRRLVVPEIAAPRTRKGAAVDPLKVHPADGFSHHPLILAWFPEGVDPANLVFHAPDPSRSLAADSPTLLLNAATGEPVLHYAELDRLPGAEGRRALQIRPLVRLENGARYVVALHGLRSAAGEPIAAPDGFRQIRDGETGSEPALKATAARFEKDVFPVVERFGVPREALQLAWDFTVQSAEHVTADLRAVRADALARLEAAPPEVAIDAVEEGEALPEDWRAQVFRRVVGRITAPSYVAPAEGVAALHRGPDGRPAHAGEREVTFVALIPQSVAEGARQGEAARVLQYGHGFFGSRDEAETGWLRQMAHERGFVVIAADWAGMNTRDSVDVVTALVTDANEALRFTDEVHQGMVELIAVTYALRGPLLAEAAFRVADRPVYDPERVYFLGISQGHILGGTYVAVSPHIRRAVLNVGGASFSFMMSRASPFGRFLGLIGTQIADPLDIQKFIALVPTVMDRIDPITYAPRILADPFPGAPPDRRVLMHAGIADTQVPNLATHLHARAMGLELLAPAPRPIPALPVVEPPAEGADVSALMEVDFGVDPDPTIEARIPERENCVHEKVRRLAPVQDQIDRFLRPDGVIVHPCDGPCRSTCD